MIKEGKETDAMIALISCIFLDGDIHDAHVLILYGLFIHGPWGSGESYLSVSSRWIEMITDQHS